MSVAMGSFALSWAELPVGGMAKRGTMTVERREWRGGERGVALGDRCGGCGGSAVRRLWVEGGTKNSLSWLGGSVQKYSDWTRFLLK